MKSKFTAEPNSFIFRGLLRVTAFRIALLATGGLASLSGVGQAQMIRTALPFTNINDSFYERIGIDFGFSLRGSRGNPTADQARGVFGYGPGGQILPNLTFSQGSVNSAIPPFGVYDPAADATFGYRVQNGKGGYHLGFRMGKGSTRTLTNTTPVLMTRNGIPGTIYNGTLNPFVTGLVPVVGSRGYPLPFSGPTVTISPLEMKLRQLHMDHQAGISTPSAETPSATDPRETPFTPAGVDSGIQSTANRGDLSVKEIKRLRALALENESATNHAKVEELIRKSAKARLDGNPGAARSYLRTAIRYSTGNQKVQLQQELQKLIDEN